MRLRLCYNNVHLNCNFFALYYHVSVKSLKKVWFDSDMDNFLKITWTWTGILGFVCMDKARLDYGYG